MAAKSEYIIRGALLRCDKGSLETRLDVPKGHGLTIYGQPAACDEDCIATVNIHPFGICSSAGYFKSAKAVKAASAHPCVLDLLERFYFADEQNTVSNAYEAQAPVKRICDEINRHLSECADILGNIHVEAGCTAEQSSIDQQKQQISIINQYIDSPIELCKNMNSFCNAVLALAQLKLSICTMLKGVVQDEIKAALLGEVEKRLGGLQQLMEELQALPPVKENFLITMDSVLICRCGGQITASESGQHQ